MKKIFSVIAAVFLTATMMLPAAVLVQAQAEQSLVIPATSQFGSGAPNVISINATSTGSTVVSAEYQTLFNSASDTLVAAEIFAQKSLAIPNPRASANVVSSTTSVPAGLPPGSIASITIFGTVSSVNATSGEWQIGTPPVFVYESANTSLQGNPVLGTNVRIEAVRTLAAGPIVADTITRLAGGSLPAASPATDVRFLFNGTIQSLQSAVRSPGVQLGAETLTAGNITFRIDDSNSPARIDPGIGLGAGLNPVVTVLFKTPLPSAVSTNIALEIRADDLAGIDPVPDVLHPNPITNPVAVPVQVPSGSWMQLDIDGVVTAVNPDGEWQIGTPPVIVYEGKAIDADTGLPVSATVFGGVRRPVQGDEVRVIATRDLALGPLVAKQIVFLTGGPLTVSAPVTDRLLRFNGAVQTMGADNWTIANVGFAVNDPLSPAVIGAGLVVGANVTASFNFIGPPPPDATLWASLTLDNTTNLHTGVLTPPAVNTERSGFLFLRVTDAQQQVTTTMVPSTLLAVPAAVPAVPGNLSAAPVSPTQVNLIWTDTSDNEVSFRVERATDANFTLNMQSFIVAANSHGLSDVAAPVNTALFYRVFAVNGAGPSLPSGMASALPPAAPSSLNANVISQTRVDLSWNHSSADETGLRVERAAANGGFSIIASLPADTLSYSDINAPAGTTLNYRVLAFNLRGDSAVAGPVQAITPMNPGGGVIVVGGDGIASGGLTTTVGITGLTGGGGMTLDSSGKTQSTVKLSNSGPGKATLDIAAGTVMKTASGTPISSLSLSTPATIPPAPPQNAIVLTSEFGPNGAAFTPPITLTLTYNESELPAGAKETEVVIAYWDGSKWVTLPTTVNAETNTASAMVEHFTMFGILAKLPPAQAPAPVIKPAPAVASAPAPAPSPAPAPAPAPSPAPLPAPVPATPEPAPVPAVPTALPYSNSTMIIGIAGAIIVLIGLAILYQRRKPMNS